MSKFTTDSGVVLYTGEVPTLPKAVPRKLPPLACVCVCKRERVKECMLVRDLVCFPLLAHIPSLVHESGERPRSSEILEQLLSQGIIPAQPREWASGEAYNMVGTGQGYWWGREKCSLL